MEGKHYYCLKGRHGDRRSARQGPPCPPCLTLHLLPNDHSGPAGTPPEAWGPPRGTQGHSTPQALCTSPRPQWPDSPNFCFPASSTLSTFDHYPGGDLLLSPPILRLLIWTFTSSVPPTVVQGLIPALILPALSMSLGSGFPTAGWRFVFAKFAQFLFIISDFLLPKYFLLSSLLFSMPSCRFLYALKKISLL